MILKHLLVGWTYWFLTKWAKLHDLQLDPNFITLQMWCFGILVGNVITLQEIVSMEIWLLFN
jgi:hypothetical protein